MFDAEEENFECLRVGRESLLKLEPDLSVVCMGVFGGRGLEGVFAKRGLMLESLVVRLPCLLSPPNDMRKLVKGVSGSMSKPETMILHIASSVYMTKRPSRAVSSQELK